MKTFGVIFLVIALFVSTLPCAAQDPIPFNELAHASPVPPSLADMRASSSAPTEYSKQIHGRSHWSRTGKIMTAIGIPVMAGGAALMGATLSRTCTNRNLSCLGDGFVVAGDVLVTAAGVAVTAVGATRRSTD